MLSIMLYTLYFVGLKKQAVDLAAKWYTTAPAASKKRNIGRAFIAWQKKYPTCDCTWPIYPNDPHTNCDEQVRSEEDEAWEWYRAEQAREEAELLQFVEEEEAKMAQQRLEEEQEEVFDDDRDDYYEDDDICPGICGQPAYACTCAETESFRRHQSDPATAGSWWVA